MTYSAAASLVTRKVDRAALTNQLRRLTFTFHLPNVTDADGSSPEREASLLMYRLVSDVYINLAY